MSDLFSRNELYWGKDVQQRLTNSSVAIFGLGGVGGYSAETLARAGVGELILVDFDVVSKSNINRQIIALNSTIGQKKTELFEARLRDINPNIKLNVISDFYTDEPIDKNVNFVIDAIDTMRSKISLIEYCVKNNIPIISSMGAGNRVDPTQLYISDISEIKNRNAPFVSNVIYQLRKRGIESGVTVVTSDEKPMVKEKISEVEQVNKQSGEQIEFTKIVPSSTPFVASTAGIFMSSYVVREIIK